MKNICEQLDLTLLTDIKNKDFLSISEDDTKFTIKHNELYFDKIDINKDYELFGLIFNNYEKISCNSYVEFKATIYKSTITEYKSICEIFNSLNLHSRNRDYSTMMLSEYWSDEDYISISYNEVIESELVQISYFKIIDKFISKGKNAEEFHLV